MKRAELVGRKDSAWLSTLLMAVLIACLGSASSEAQTPSILATAPPPPVEPGARTGGTSTVSSVIERYVKQSGRDVPRAEVARQVPPPIPPRPPASPPTPGGPSPSPVVPPRSTGPNPLAVNMTLKPAPVEPTDRRFPINLATALRLSDARPLIVASAQASVWVAEAELTRAKVLWIPSLTMAADYIRHDGGGPDFNKGILTAPSVNYFYAGPSLFQYLNLTDAIFEPLAARQVLNSRHFDVQSAKNDALQRTADAYFLVHQYRGVYAGTLYSVQRGRDLLDRIKDLSSELVTRVEVDRARNLLADLEQQAVSARQEWRVQSANLTQVLRLDPRAVVEPLEHDHAQVTLIDPAKPLDDLMAIALTNRPELGSRRALVAAAEARVRREKARPLLPLVMLNGFQTSGGMMIQGGIFGLGPNSSLNQWSGRDDVSIQLVWQLEGAGIGNLAKVKGQRGEQSRMIVDLRKTQDMVAGDVTRAQARVQSAAARILQADRALRTGIITFNGQIEGLGQTRRFGDVLELTYRPQEAVYSLKLLNTAFEEYFTTVAEYNRAQFELFHAVGYPARELAGLKPIGEVLPVDTSRPAFLPQVGNGPPPATR
jgi:outer membrane protein TolC